MSENYSFKEFYDVILKSTRQITIGNRTIEPGEVIMSFDRIQIASLMGSTTNTKASGGYDGRTLISWTRLKELNLAFAQGIMNNEQLALGLNSKLYNQNAQTAQVHQRENVEVDENGDIIIKYNPLLQKGFYVYKKSDGSKLTLPATLVVTQVQTGYKVEIEGEAYLDVVVDYMCNQNVDARISVGNQLLTGFVELEGRTKVQDDITGTLRTGIIKIPRLQLMSELSIRLGKQATPVVGTFNAIGMPVGERGNEYVMELLFLEDDIDIE